MDGGFDCLFARFLAPFLLLRSALLGPFLLPHGVDAPITRRDQGSLNECERLFHSIGPTTTLPRLWLVGGQSIIKRATRCQQTTAFCHPQYQRCRDPTPPVGVLFPARTTLALKATRTMAAATEGTPCPHQRLSARAHTAFRFQGSDQDSVSPWEKCVKNAHRCMIMTFSVLIRLLVARATARRDIIALVDERTSVGTGLCIRYGIFLVG